MVVQNNKAVRYYEWKRQHREQNSQLSGEGAFYRVREAALGLLDYRDYSSGELVRKLRDRGYPVEIVTAVVERLKEVGLINDLSYARALLRGKFQAKGVVGSALRADLMRKAIPVEIIDEVISEIDSSEIRAKAEELVQKKLRTMAQVDFQKQRNRLISMLLRKGYHRGFSYEIVNQILVDYRYEE